MSKQIRFAPHLARFLGSPLQECSTLLGHEDFDAPGSHQLMDLPPQRPNVVHLHNLHGGYFDLRILPTISQQVTTIVHLHDAWLLSGHCAHGFDCMRWSHGCGDCPDLTIYPSIHRDATEFNWNRKRDIFSNSRLFVATPCRWLMNRVEQSNLAHGIVDARVIPYGVDLAVFKRGDKDTARHALGLSPNANVLLFVATDLKRNIWKDYTTMKKAIEQLAMEDRQRPLVFVGLGEQAPTERIKNLEIRFVPSIADAPTIARYYQAADVYLHAAHVDTFPNTILEALACGTPVIGTRVGGIPEQIEENVTGFVTEPADADSMAKKIKVLLDDPDLLARFSCQAAKSAKREFSNERMVDAYFHWYEEILDRATSLAAV